jgi:hypothetical protein
MKLLLRAIIISGLTLAVTAPAATAIPSITYSCSPGPATCEGWYDEPVTIDWTLLPAPPTSTDVVGCTDETISSDTTSHVSYCAATFNGRVTVEVPLRVDMTAPLLTGASAARPPDGNGWYRSPVQVSFAGNDVTSGIAACTSTTYGGPDNASASVVGVCRDRAGNLSQSSSFALKFDATPPAINDIVPARKPDHGSWYTKPVGLSASAADGLSGLAGCDPLAYAGPEDSAAAVVQPVCRDVAGNVGSRVFTIPYDDSAPALKRIKTRPGDRIVRFNWAAADADKVRVMRSPGRGGDERTELHDGPGNALVDAHVRNGRRYEYRFIAVDQAGNVSSRMVGVVPGPRLLSPDGNARVDEPPRLRWTPVRGADYYNVQLFRGDRKVLSTWPTRSRLQLRRAWRYLGERRLEPGRYRWIVWPGEGPRSANDYGPRIGRRSFVYAPN